MLKIFKVRSRCTVPSHIKIVLPLRNPMTEKFAMTGSVDGYSVQPENQFVGTSLRVDTTQVSSEGGSLPLWDLQERDQSLISNHH